MQNFSNLSKSYTEFLSKLSTSYTKFVTPSEEGAYPIVDRIISYGLPTAGAVLWSVYGTHENYEPLDKGCVKYGLLGGLAFYAVSQVGLTYAKPLVEVKEEDSSFDKGWKKIAAGGIEVFDVLNNVVPYTIAMNMLPGTYCLNEVAAWRVMPAIIEGVESDITAAVNGKTYTKTFAGDIFSSTIAGFASVNLRDTLSKQVLGNELYQNFNDSKYTILDKDEIRKLNLKVLTELLVEDLSYPLIKKLFMKTSYKNNEIEQDILKGFMKNIFKNSSLGQCETAKFKDTVFEGIGKFTAAGLVPKLLAYASGIIADFEIHCDTNPELCRDSTNVFPSVVDYTQGEF
jgi:hypothetical protein